MDIIIMPKGAGKTTELTKISARTGYYIICHSQKEAARISFEAKKRGLDIPLPITYGEFLRGAYYTPGAKGFLIDNLDMLLRYITRVPIYAATITGRIISV